MKSSSSTEDYLSSIMRITSTGAKATVSAIAAYLKVKKPSVSQMVKKLARKKLLIHDSYGGISLTKQGEKTAKRIVFKHRVIEYFLAKKLNRSPKHVHEEAHRLEHAFDDQTVLELYNFLQRPKRGIHSEAIEPYGVV